MMEHHFAAYMGLLRSDGTEPPKESGYARIPVGVVEVRFNFPERNIDCTEIQKLPFGKQIVFPDVAAEGYGAITTLALFFSQTGGDAVWLWPLPEPVDLKPGMIPFIHNGRLYKGVEVKARIVAKSADQCGGEVLRNA